MKPFFSARGLRDSGITLVEGDKIISEEKEVAETLNNVFANAVKSLHIIILSGDRSSDEEPLNVDDPIEAIIIKYSNHSSIKSINKMLREVGLG